jgi:type 1 glutamine amidotransferase
MTAGSRAVIASGAGRYADPWHRFAATSRRLQAVLEDAGFTVNVHPDLDGAMTRLEGVHLLVINAGDPWQGPGDPPAPASIAGFGAAVGRGIGLLGIHVAAATMRDYPEWTEAFGAIWLPGISRHPPIGEARITITASHLGAELESFDVFDERYSGLQRVGRSDIVATHEVDGVTCPTAWTRVVGRARVAADLLGHDERSYDSPGHRALVASLARWASSAPRD